MKNWINDKIDMIVYDIWYRRWSKKLNEKPELIIPFMESIMDYVETTLPKGRINEMCRRWKGIRDENPTPQHGDDT
jgi:hypothetical protein